MKLFSFRTFLFRRGPLAIYSFYCITNTPVLSSVSTQLLNRHGTLNARVYIEYNGVSIY